MNRFFMYVDPTEYDMTQEGLMKACIAEVIRRSKRHWRLSNVWRRRFTTVRKVEV